MTARRQIFLPCWVSEEVRHGLTSPDGCRCYKFCRYYANGGVGTAPSPLDLCPLYFRDRSGWFTTLARYTSAEFVDKCTLEEVDSAKSIFVRFTDASTFVRFGRGSYRDHTRFDETFEVYRDGRPIDYRITSPVDAGPNPVAPGILNLERRLGNYLSGFVFPGLPH